MMPDCKLDVTGAPVIASSALFSIRRTHLDLFSGIGGFSIAAQAAGYQTIAFAEIEPYACKILKQNWPTIPNLGDIRNVRGIRADLITGGFPCQPFSLVGKRRGAEDDRHLWPEMCRVIEDARPRWVLGENVPGIIGVELDNVLSDLERLGYTAWPLVIPACAVDARHRRDRVWIVAHSAQGGIRCGMPSGETGQLARRGETVADSNGINGRTRTGRQDGQKARHAGQDVANASNGTDHEGGTQRHQWPLENGDGESGGRACHWLPEPGVGRVANGIPHRSHRLKAIGNAIVPQVAETLIRMMARMENDKLTP